jgi:hypothetical protein
MARAKPDSSDRESAELVGIVSCYYNTVVVLLFKLLGSQEPPNMGTTMLVHANMCRMPIAVRTKMEDGTG